MQLLTAKRAQDQESLRGQSSSNEPEQLEARGVRPVEVLDLHDERLPSRCPFQELVDRVEQAEALVFGRRTRLRRRTRLDLGHQAGERRPATISRDRAPLRRPSKEKSPEDPP